MARKALTCFMAALAMALASPLMAQDDLCDDVDWIAEGWDSDHVALDQSAAAGLPERDVEEYAALILEGGAHARELADALVRQDVKQQRQLGRQLTQALDAMEGARGVDAILDAMDGVIVALHLIVEGCDADRLAGSISVNYQPTQQWGPLAERLRGSGVFERIAESVSTVVALPTDLQVVFAECGQPNAFYADRQVNMCYEFFALLVGAFSQDGTSSDERLGKALGVGAFFYLHQLGHALMHMLEIPISGRDEGSVDTLTTLILLQGGGESALLSAIEHFGAVAGMTEGQGQFAFWKEHSLDSQRLYDIACLVYGSNPQTYRAVVGQQTLPEERASRCEAEYQRTDLAWNELLAPHYRESRP